MQYKLLIRKQMLKQKRLHPKLRSCHLAERLKIEPSYLSRFFTDTDVHFSDELLFSLLRELDMNHEGIDQILTLKEFERCTHPERKRYLEQKLSLMKLIRLRHEFDRIKKALPKRWNFSVTRSFDRYENMRSIFAFLILTLISVSAFAHEGQVVIVRTQWTGRSFADPIVSLFSPGMQNKMQISGTGAMYTYDDRHGCTDLLKKMFQYPLGQMVKDKYITQEMYDFLMSTAGHLDPRQIVFLNRAKVSSQTLDSGRSILPNLVPIFENETRHTVQALQSAAEQWLNVDGSMWVVRGQIPDKSAARFYLRKEMPWEHYPSFTSMKETLHRDDLAWEFGRANKEVGSDFHDFMQMGATTATKDALALNVPLAKGRVFINTKNKKMADHVATRYGFSLKAQNGADDFLMEARLDQLVDRLGPVDFLLNQAVLKDFFPKLNSEQLQAAEHKIYKSFFHHLDDKTSTRAGEGILLFNGDYSPHIHERFLEIEPQFASLRHPAKFDIVFNEGVLALQDRTAKMVVRKESTDWGIAHLSELRFKEDPQYLERIITETLLYNKKLIRGLKHRGAIPEPTSARGIFMATPSEAIAKKAQGLGAQVQKQLVESASRVDLKKKAIEYNATIETYYLIRFENSQVNKIAQEFSVSAPPKSFEEGLKQIEHDFLSPF